MSPSGFLLIRRRAEDIPGLAQYFLERYAKEVKKHFAEITEAAMERLCAYDWPGNVRELANVIERAVVLANGPAIRCGDLPQRIGGSEPRPERPNVSYREAMEAARRDVVLKALAQTRGNRAAAAKSLGLHEKYFLRLIKTLRLTG